MNVPGIDYNAPVEDPSQAIAKVSAAQRESLNTISQGFQALAQEMVKTRTQRAAADVQVGMAKQEAEIASHRYMPLDQVKQELGDQWDSLAPEIKNHQETVEDPNTGQPINVIPTYLVAGTVFQKRVRDQIDEAAKQIPGEGWQNAFKESAIRDMAERGHYVARTQGHQMVEDYKRSSDATVDQYLRAGEDATDPDTRKSMFGQALATIDHSNAYEPGEKALKRENVLATMARADDVSKKVKQAAEVETAASGILQGSKTPGYLWVDPQKASDAVDAIPDDNPNKAHVRELVEHQVAQSEKLRTEAVRTALNQADALQAQGVPLSSAQMAPIKAWMLDPKNGAASDWFALLNRQNQQQKQDRALAREATAEQRREAADAKRAQAETDSDIIHAFDGMDLKGQDGQDQVSVPIDHKSFPEASDNALNILRYKQRKATEEYQRDMGAQRTLFLDKVKASTEQQELTEKQDQDKFRSYMLNHYQAWRAQNPTAVLGTPETEKAVDGMFLDANKLVGGWRGHFTHEAWRDWQAVPAPSSTPSAAPAPATGPLRAGYKVPTPERRVAPDGRVLEIGADGHAKVVQ